MQPNMVGSHFLGSATISWVSALCLVLGASRQNEMQSRALGAPGNGEGTESVVRCQGRAVVYQISSLAFTEDHGFLLHLWDQ